MLYFNFFVLNGGWLLSWRFVHVVLRIILKVRISSLARYEGLLHLSPSLRFTN